jgi:hypothetical protein
VSCSSVYSDEATPFQTRSTLNTTRSGEQLLVLSS